MLALPRGGLPVASVVARALHAPLDVFVVRKLGVPGQEELAMGAIASGGTLVVNDEVVEMLGIGDAVLQAAARRETDELQRRERLYRGDRPPLSVAGRTVLLIDDGVATGSTMLAATRALRHLGPARIIAAVPVGARAVLDRLREVADEVISVFEVDQLEGVSLWYSDFRQTTDDEVRTLLAQAAVLDVAHSAAEPGVQAVRIPAGGVLLDADLALPAAPRGLVLFAHGSGSSRHSARNRRVAGVLQNGGYATLLLDLLTADEEAVDERTRHLRFDIGLLTGRLVAATDWADANAGLRNLPIGYFGASTGAAAALLAAARRPARVGAVVSRGGRPDLAGDALRLVRAPTLLIVGGRDVQVIELNRTALDALRSQKQLHIIPQATHLFEEPGALDKVARLALDWFQTHLHPAGERAQPPGGSRP